MIEKVNDLIMLNRWEKKWQINLSIGWLVAYFWDCSFQCRQGRIAGARGFTSILKKILIFTVVGMGHLLDTILLGGSGAPLRSAMIFFYIANEGLSIIENLAALGVPIPKRLRQLVAELGEDDPALTNKKSHHDQ